MKQFPARYRFLPFLFLGLILLPGIATLIAPLRDGAERMNRLPAYGDGFISREAPLTRAESIVFGNARVVRRQLLCRTKKANLSLVLTVIDGTHNRHAVHDPTYCIRGAGWQKIVDERFVQERFGTMRFVRVRRGSEQRELLYFYTNGQSHYDSWLRCWKEATLRRLTFGLSGEEPLLVLIETDPTARTNSSTISIKQVMPTLAKIVAPL